jgi:hypothetical protein
LLWTRWPHKHNVNVFTYMEHKGCTEVTQTLILYLYQVFMSDIISYLLHGSESFARS